MMSARRRKRIKERQSRQRRRRIILWGGSVLAAGVALLSFVYVGGLRGQSGDGNSLPRFVLGRGAPVREAYAYAVDNPDVLRYIPCYCGCVSQGHANNEECFVDERRSDGTIVFDRHGAT